MFFKTYFQHYQPKLINSVSQPTEKKEKPAAEIRPLPNFKQLQPGFYCFSFPSAGNSGSFPGNEWQFNFTPFRRQEHCQAETPERIPGTGFVRAGGQPNDAYSRYDLPVYCFT